MIFLSAELKFEQLNAARNSISCVTVASPAQPSCVLIGSSKYLRAGYISQICHRKPPFKLYEYSLYLRLVHFPFRFLRTRLFPQNSLYLFTCCSDYLYYATVCFIRIHADCYIEKLSAYLYQILSLKHCRQ